MIDTEKRVPGKYKEEFSKIMYGVKVQITEEIVVGRDFEILSFSREYNPAIPYIMPSDGEYVNTYTTKVKGNDITFKEIAVIKDGSVISFDKVHG